jgi:DtxR family Mn-dependent transcriptional regulator
MQTKENRELMLRVPASCRPRQAKDRDKHELTESIEEYTEGIWRLQEELEVVTSGEVAKYMSVSPASATTMLKRLAELNLVEHTPYQGVRLTKRGETISIALLRKHRLVERLLVDFLELPWDDVHELACKLEHYLSEDVADRIAKAMNYPTTCPHGNPIDATEKDNAKRISECEIGNRLTVARISDERVEFLSYIVDIGLVPNARVNIKSKTPFGDVITLTVDGRDDNVAIGRDVAASIWVFDESEPRLKL